ncbi:MAG TPA: pitrilysin family protein [Bryobacteraceae bacterium]|jgi:zinc protease|nr:pitrilysin family protein [Bryobacteraceae bacterium]
MRNLAPLALILGLLLAPIAPAQTKVTSVEGITEYRLDNGLQVLLFPDNSKPTVTVNVTYMVGSRNEGAGETGMAHLLEHMLFKGTQKHKEIMGELSAHGNDFNGSTSWDRTNYFETVPASDADLRWALEMESDRMVNSRVAKSDLDSEMTVVRNEFERGENSPDQVLEERVLSTAYLWHAYGRSPIGTLSDIEKVPIEKLQAFYRNYYQPDDAMLLVAGKFDPAKTLGWINELFGVIPKPTRKLLPTYTEEPTQDGEREVVLRRVGDHQSVMMAFHVPAGSHPDSPALDVLSAILSEAPSGRLYKALVESKKAVSADAENYSLHDPGVEMFSATVAKDKSLDDAEKTMLSVIDGLIKEPPNKEEVDRARTRLLKNIDLELNNSGRVGLVLSEWGSMGDWRLLFLNRDRVEKVTPEDVARVAKLYLKPANRTIGRYLPEAQPDRSVIPASPDVVSELKDYKGKAAIEDGEVFDPSPANIEARTTRITLPSGLKLVLLPKKTRGGTVVANLQLHFGDEKSLANKGAAPRLAGALLMRGTRKHTRQQLQDEFDRIKAQVGVTGTLTGASARIDTVRAGLIPALQLAAEILQQPSFPESDFEQIRQAAIAQLEAGRSEPQNMASIAMNRYLNAAYPAGDPRYSLTIDESIDQLKKVTLDEAKKFYTDFYGASNAELAVVGDFDAAEVQKLAQELFSSWKSPQPYSVVKRSWTKLSPVNTSLEAPDKANAYLYAVTPVSMDQQDPDYPAMVLADRILGGDEKSRLWVRIREKDGLSYGVNSNFRAGPQEKYGVFAAVASAKNENTAKVEDAFKDEITKAATTGFTAEEVATAKTALMQERQLGRSQDNQLVGLLVSQAELGRTMQRESDLEKKINDTTPEQLSAIFKKWIDPATISYFKAGDFKKAAAK